MIGYIIFLFIFSVLIPFLLILLGWFFLNKPPKKINGLYGYRTSMSMKNTEMWAVAHKTCGKIGWKMGWTMAALSVLLLLPPLWISSDEESAVKIFSVVSLILCILQTAFLVLSILPVEKALKQNFNPDGTKKAGV